MVIFKIARKIIKTPTSILHVLQDETEFKNYLQKKHQITKLKTTDITNFLQNFKGEINDFAFLDGSSLVTDIAVLKSIASSITDCEYLEIGTWRGESIINVAEVAKNCTSINLAPKDIIEMGNNKRFADLQNCLIKDKTNISFVQANSLKFDFESLRKKFDLIFVDGDHTYDAVKSDTKNVFKLLKNENSMIIWHDVAFNPEKPRYSVISAIMDGMPKETHENIYHISNTISAIYTKQKLTSAEIESPIEPDKVFKVSIECFPIK